MIRLIASDMDGTLLGPKMDISKENVAAIKEAAAAGVTFMVATGRGYYEAKPALEEAGIECGMIAVNGAQVFEKDGSIVFSVPIDKDRSAKVIEIFQRHNTYFEIATNQGVFSDNQARRLENVATMLANSIPHLTFKTAIGMAAAYLEMLHIRYIDRYDALLDDPEIEILKFIAFSSEEQKELDPIAKKIKPLGELAVTSSSVTNIEVNHIDAQKGIAVAHVAKSMGIPLSEVMTIGDNFNDLSMLQTAGVSFAMGNAVPHVKEIAKYETASNLESGVGQAIRRAIAENL